MISKLGIRFVIRQCLMSLMEFVNPTLRERIDKSIVGKLINGKVNFGLGAPIKEKKFENLLMNLHRNSINQSLDNFKEGESTAVYQVILEKSYI